MSEDNVAARELPARKTVDDVLNTGLPNIRIDEESRVYTYETGNAPKDTYWREVLKRYPVNKREFSDDLAVIEGHLRGLGVLRRPLNEDEQLQAKKCFALVLKSQFLGVNNKDGPVEPQFWDITGSEKALRGYRVARRYRQEFSSLNKRGFNMLARAVPLLGNEGANTLVSEEILTNASDMIGFTLDKRIPQIVKIFSAKGAKINEKNQELLKFALSKYGNFKADSDSKDEINWRKKIIEQAEKIVEKQGTVLKLLDLTVHF